MKPFAKNRLSDSQLLLLLLNAFVLAVGALLNLSKMHGFAAVFYSSLQKSLLAGAEGKRQHSKGELIAMVLCIANENYIYL